MKKYSYSYENIHCSCGNVIHADLEGSLVSEIGSDSFEDSYEQTEEYECDECNMKYKLEIHVQKTIEVTYTKVEATGVTEVDTNGNPFPLIQLINVSIGDEVLLEDGTYMVADREYKIEDQILVSSWGAPDENQLSLFKEEKEHEHA